MSKLTGLFCEVATDEAHQKYLIEGMKQQIKESNEKIKRDKETK